MPSFDIVSQVNSMEIENAVNQAKKELAQRFDFKGSESSIELDKAQKTVTLKTENEYRLKTLVDLLQTKCVKRGVSLKALKFEALETGMIGGSIKQVVTIQSGIPSDKAKEIVKSIKESKIKVQAQIMDDKVRVTGKKLDDLQTVIAHLKENGPEYPLQFVNFT